LKAETEEVEQKKEKENEKEIEKEEPTENVDVHFCLTNDILVLWKRHRTIKHTKVHLFAQLAGLKYKLEPGGTVTLSYETKLLVISWDTPALVQVWFNKLDSACKGLSAVENDTTNEVKDEGEILEVLNSLETGVKANGRNLHGISFKVVGHELVENYVLYHIEVIKRGEQKYIIKQRFSNILSDLHKAFGKSYGLLAPPKRNLEALVNGTDDKFIEKRKKELQDYFDELTKKVELDTTNCHFADFFQLPDAQQNDSKG